MSDIQLFQILKQKMGEQEAEALVTFVDHKIKENNEFNLSILATKADIHDLKGNLEVKIADSKAEMIKWMFIFWIGQLATFIAIAKFFFKKSLIFNL